MQPIRLPDIQTAKNYADYLPDIVRGLEKESLRIRPDGYLASTPHPDAWGSSLTNRFITTDYSEALPEFITTAATGLESPLKQLDEIHRFCYPAIQDELLWTASMPCIMGDEKDIPIARYGTSNSARMKEIYRIGLGYRYGRLMQTIAGVHYNFSLPRPFWEAMYQNEQAGQSFQDFVSEKYMALIRNYLRYAWVIPYFWGASPAICQSFLKGKSAELEELLPGTRYGRYATSLRMSDLGYQNKVQSLLNVSYNSLPAYIQGLEQAIRTPDPLYEEIGVVVDGEYRQLNANILQIENEFYGTIRPKRTSQSGQRPTKALAENGVEYIEIRSLDLNPYEPCGISQEQIAFLDAFLLACLFIPSNEITPREMGEIKENFKAVVARGRHPDLTLIVQNRPQPIQQILRQILKVTSQFADLLSESYKDRIFCDVIKRLSEQIDRPEQTISGRLVKSIEDEGKGFFALSYDWSNKIKREFLERPLDAERNDFYTEEALISHQKQAQLERGSEIPFEDFLARYYQ